MILAMNDVIKVLKQAMPDADIDYQVSGNRLMLRVESSIFKDMNRVQRQRHVNQILKPYIDSGEVHAVSLQVGVKDECKN